MSAPRKSWRIVSSAGVDMGVFAGATAEEALDAMARDAGCESYADACRITGRSPRDWTTSVFAFHGGAAGLLVSEVQS